MLAVGCCFNACAYYHRYVLFLLAIRPPAGNENLTNYIRLFRLAYSC